MIIKSLEIKNYRNYEKESIEFASGSNLIYGDNAQGKTNILEAIYLLSTTKSHRGSKDKEIIRFASEEAHIKAFVEKREVEYRIDMHLRKSKTKGIAINGIPIKKAMELFGIVNIILFSPEDLSIIKEGPSERRRFIDMELCQINKLYMHNLSEYNKVLFQRNKLLKELKFKPNWQDTLDIWDMQILKFGKEMIRYREEFIRELNEFISDIHYSISDQKEVLELKYEYNTSIEDFEKALFHSRDNDIRLKTTNVGPHRDDIAFIVKLKETEEMDLRKYGSQGQQRTAALSLKLAELELVKNKINDYPILLLDDVLSELDAKRQANLLHRVSHIQTIITCTGVEDFLNSSESARLNLHKLFFVKNGEVFNELIEKGKIDEFRI